MSMIYFNGTSKQMNAFLEKGRNTKTFRAMDDGEVFILDDIRRTLKAMNLLITECIAICGVFNATGNKEIKYLENNMHRIINSVRGQRDFLAAVKLSFMSVKPEPGVYKEVKATATKCKTRMKYLRETVLPANIDLTPIPDYMEIRGYKTMREDMLSYFGTYEHIMNASKNGRIEEYAKNIFRIVTEAGRGNDFQVRLSEYVQMDKARKAKFNQEKQAEKNARIKRDSEAGLDRFCSKFYQCVLSLSGNDSIGVSALTMQKKIDAHGREACVILCSYPYGDHMMNRYVRADLGNGTTLASARVFEKGEADTVYRELSAKNPEKAYAVCPLSY